MSTRDRPTNTISLNLIFHFVTPILRRKGTCRGYVRYLAACFTLLHVVGPLLCAVYYFGIPEQGGTRVFCEHNLGCWAFISEDMRYSAPDMLPEMFLT